MRHAARRLVALVTLMVAMTGCLEATVEADPGNCLLDYAGARTYHCGTEGPFTLPPSPMR